MIKLKGRMLLYNAVNDHDHNVSIFPNDCDIVYSKKVPVYWIFDYARAPIGVAHISRDEKGLNAEVRLYDSQFFVGRHDVKIGIGGYYSNIEYEEKEPNVVIVSKAYLKCVSLLLTPVNDNYYLDIVEE